MAKRLIPLLDRVLVEKIVAPTKSVGGILLPESAVSKVRDASRFRRFDAVSNNPKCRPRDPQLTHIPFLMNSSDQRGEGSGCGPR